MKSEILEMERQRQELVRQLLEMLIELEGKPVSRPAGATRKMPFILLERSVSWMLVRAERLVDRLVAAVLNSARSR